MEDLATGVNSITHKIVTEVRETENEFIFAILNSYIESHYEIKVEKWELFQAVLLIQRIRRLKENTGYDLNAKINGLGSPDVMEIYEEMYNKGFEDGKEEVINKIRGMLFGEGAE
jgi:hypothetical protein